MQNFFDWFSSIPQNKQSPWLILGKGPSYSKLDNFDVSGYLKISLNHVIRDQKVTIAHIIDFDVAVDCAEMIDRNSDVLVMPWQPHIKNGATPKILIELLDEHPILRRLNQDGRVKFYNFGSGNIVADSSPVIPFNYFSSEAVVNLLVKSGITKIRTLGIDGGNTYSDKFKDLTEKTLLNNGHQSFDVQFKSIAKKIMKQNLDYAPLDVESPVKIYVGSMPEQMLAVRVLEYSIKKNSSLPVEVKPLFQGGIKIPMPKDQKNMPRTPFSFQRFIIPQLNGYKGKAIYVDSDMQVFVDVKDLWSRDMKDAEIFSAFENSTSGRKPQYSVMLIDCEKLKWKIEDIIKKLDSGELDYELLMFEMKVASKIDPVIEREWNSLEFFEPGKTKLLHYTDMNKQPWLFLNNPLTKIWVKELHEAINEGFISLGELKEHIKKGNVRPSLWYQVRRRNFDITKIPNAIKMLDKFFVPPHMRNESNKHKRRLNSLACRLVTLI